MKTNNLARYINGFFGLLEKRDSKHIAIEQAIITFLNDETKSTAFEFYEVFFGAYRIVLEGKSNPFADLLDVLRNYEERAATVIDRQRDHYIHSVNVFILGLCVYSQNEKYRTAFEKANIDRTKYPENYENKHEEFLFRWGLTALFHDVGYPVQIIAEQLGNFMKFVTEIDCTEKQGANSVHAHLNFKNFRQLNSVAEISPKKLFIKDFYAQTDSSVYIDLLQPVDLLAQKIHLSLGLDIKIAKEKLDTYIHDMATHGFIDHGFYSALILLKWYGYLIQKTSGNPLRFYNAIVDSASAILLHNYFGNYGLKFFKCEPMAPESHPLAYLIILCDEMQEWNRLGYGKIDKTFTQATAANISVDNDQFAITYLAEKGTFPQKFIDDKTKLFAKLLNISAVFSNGLKIECDAVEEIFAEAKTNNLVPRPLFENMEKLAKAIHDDYIAGQKKSNAPINVADNFEDLDDSSRYANLRQAMNINKKLRLIGFALVSADEPGGTVTEFPKEIIEQYAIMEHDDWVNGKRRNGWKYAEVRNDKNREHNCMIDWKFLSETERDKDRSAATNIFKLAALIEMKVIRLK